MNIWNSSCIRIPITCACGRHVISVDIIFASESSVHSSEVISKQHRNKYKFIFVNQCDNVVKKTNSNISHHQ